MAVEQVRVRNADTGAEVEVPVTVLGLAEYDKWKPVDEPAKTRARSGSQEG